MQGKLILNFKLCVLFNQKNLEKFFIKNLRIFRSTSGKSSKLEVSSIDLTSTAIAAGLSLIWFQSTP